MGPSSATGWKPNERLAQGKRSDTLGNRVQRGKPRPVRAKAYNPDRLSYWLIHVTSSYITLLPLQGEQEELGCRNPRVPLRSALGYAQIALSGRTRNPRCAGCPFRSDKFGCARHSIQGKLDALLSLARTVRADTNQRHQPLRPQFGTVNWTPYLLTYYIYRF